MRVDNHFYACYIIFLAIESNKLNSCPVLPEAWVPGTCEGRHPCGSLVFHAMLLPHRLRPIIVPGLLPQMRGASRHDLVLEYHTIHRIKCDAACAFNAHRL